MADAQQHPERTTTPATRVVALGQLLRLSLTASAAADIAAGFVLSGALASPGWGSAFTLGIASSLFIYHGALALNDWHDREHDARTRPERPIPSGALSERLAFCLGIGLVLSGILLGFAINTRAGVWALALALVAVGYDFVGRGPWRGPTLLGLCRFGNLGYGLVLGGRLPFDLEFVLPLAYGAYVFTLSRLGRLEDGEDDDLQRRPPRVLFALGALLLTPGALALALGIGNTVGALAALALGAAGATGLFSLSRRKEPWTRAEVGRAMGVSLRRLLFFTAAVSLLQGTREGTLVALAIGAGFPLSRALRRVFPPS